MTVFTKAHAPYNFVPFTTNPLPRYDDFDELPPHDQWDPTLLSGEITVTLTAETPVFLSNGQKDAKADFFRSLSGGYAIPGSSFRGLLRQNMQILGLGIMRPDEDYKDVSLLYRQVAGAKRALSGGLRRRYAGLLGDEDPDTHISQNVRAGFLVREEKGKYCIYETTRIERVSRQDMAAAPWRERWAFFEPVWYANHGGKLILSKEKIDDGIFGMLLGTGWMNNQKHLYFFQNETTGNKIQLEDEDVYAYEEDWEMRRNTLKKSGKFTNDPKFWKLPEMGERKPVFFVSLGNGHYSFGMSAQPRLAFDHSIGDGIPHKTLAQQQPPFLDYAYAMMGFTGKQWAYASRVTVQDLMACRTAKTMKRFDTLLSEPKLSFYPGYVQNGQHYNTDDFRMRGFKQYWLKECQYVPSDNKSMATAMLPLPAGTTFTGTVRYHNLHEDELGLLLWCIRLEEGCFHTVGMGKPYGFGRVSARIDGIWEYDVEKLYSDGNLRAGKEAAASANRVQALIEAYQHYVEDRPEVKTDIYKLPSIRDFLYIKRTVRDDVAEISYMSLQEKEYQNIQSPLPTIAEVAEEEQHSSQTPAQGGISDYCQLQPGMIVRGRVTGIQDYGFFVELCRNVSGLVHISEVDFKYITPDRLRDYVDIGDWVNVKVLSVEGPRRISLSYKQAAPG